MRISVVGCGYLGAVHATAMAHLGHEVIGIDREPGRIDQLNRGSAPFFEPGLEELLSEGLQSGRLRFSTDITEVATAQVHFLAVGTPQEPNGTGADLTFIDAAMAELIPHLSPGDLVVGKSTVPVGTAERLAVWLAQDSPGTHLAWNPEFLREGLAIQDTLRPDRLVYGLPETPDAEVIEHTLDHVYAEIVAEHIPKVVTNFSTAELVKVAANAFLATKISFINAMAEVSDATGADVIQLADALGHDARIGRKFLNAGLGFGGGCLPKDIRAFTARADELGVGDSVNFLREVDSINLRRRDHVVNLVVAACEGSVQDRSVTVLGTTFKPNSDDVRDSPALDVAVKLNALGAQVTVTDPQGLANAIVKHPQLIASPDTGTALAGAEVVVLATEWEEYRTLDPVSTRQLVSKTRKATMIDARNALSASDWKDADWDYIGMGRHSLRTDVDV